MSVSMGLWLAVAVGVFWVVGLYNRLMRMRARGLEALGSVEKHMRRYAELVHAQLAESDPEATTSPADEWLALVEALDALDLALKEVRRNPLAQDPMLRVTVSLHALQLRWSELENTPPDLAGPAMPPTMQLQWGMVSEKVLIGRNALNQILLGYNQSLEQFPARIIVGLLGFKPAGLV